MKSQKEKIGGVPENVFGMFADLCIKMKKGVILPEHLAMFLKKQDNIFGAQKTIFIAWQIFFQKYFGLNLDLSNLKIPSKQEGFDRLIIVPEGITPNRIYEACAKNFPCWKWTEDLDKAVVRNDRESRETYAGWVRDRRESDEENKNISADQAKEKKIQGITLGERLILELKYWDETREHLDVENVTICSGSRYSDGGVPRVDYYDGGMNVGWCDPQRAHSGWRVRTVVSF